jgi:hypothetical protein
MSCKISSVYSNEVTCFRSNQNLTFTAVAGV